ncbi:MAG: CRTAC1 family protein [Pseudomonadota bacterium]
MRLFVCKHVPQTRSTVRTGLLLAALASGAAASAVPGFEDVSAQFHWERIWEPAVMGLGGAAWLDYDSDGDLDLFVTNSAGGANALFRNDGKGGFVDVASAAGVAGGAGHTGAAVADVDNNGTPDLFLTGAGSMFGAGISSRLYLNNGDGTFSDATESAGIDTTLSAMMPIFGDIDLDGYVDLFLTVPGNLLTGEMAPQMLYRNNGDGTFSDISASAGVDTAKGGCVAAFTDVNRDLRPDIVVGNCNALDLSGGAPLPIPGPWELWINQGDNTFVDAADAAGLNARPGFPMAMTVGDPDLDGDFDMFATGMGIDNPFAPGLLGEQVLFLNDAVAGYRDGTYSNGLGGFEWGWGASFADFDNDGDEDLATTGSVAGAVLSFLGEQGGPGRIFENDGTGALSATHNFGLQDLYTSGLAVADYDGDGFTDIAIVKTAFEIDTPEGVLSGDGRPVLLRNQGNGNRSVTVRLEGTASNRMGIGARVWLANRYGRQVREVSSGNSFASNSSPWLTFGMRDAWQGRVVVRWPSGTFEMFGVTAGGPVVTLTEGAGTPL